MFGRTRRPLTSAWTPRRPLWPTWAKLVLDPDKEYFSSSCLREGDWFLFVGFTIHERLKDGKVERIRYFRPATLDEEIETFI